MESFKTVLLGESYVGKTCIARLLIERRVAEENSYRETIGFDHFGYQLETDGIPVVVCVVNSPPSLPPSSISLISVFIFPPSPPPCPSPPPPLPSPFPLLPLPVADMGHRWNGEVQELAGHAVLQEH